MTAGNGILILGIAWLLFWLGPAFFLFREDPRWGHNFAIPLTFITAGLASNTRIISCQLVAVTGAFFLVPTLLAYWSWAVATMISGGLLGIFLILYFIETRRENELIVPNTRLRTWLKIHLLTFAYIGLAHTSSHSCHTREIRKEGRVFSGRKGRIYLGRSDDGYSPHFH